MNHMKIKIVTIYSISAIAFVACFSPAQVSAQSAPQPPHTQATPLPLSGRPGNSGSVIAIEAPSPEPPTA